MRHCSDNDRQRLRHKESILEIVPEWEQVLVLFEAGTSSLWSSLGTFFVPAPAPCEAFSLDI